MNYGRYFRLNLALSKVVDGVAIYDYIDLPAYFGPSVDNPMSPKYPISVTITTDTVCFRLHYSAFKLEKKESNLITPKTEINENERKSILGNEYPQYAYRKKDIDNKSLPKIGNIGLTDVGMAHMEEVILELPFADISSCRLSDTIKNIYYSTFPQVIDENTSMGGRYLEQLIKKRFPIEKDKESGNGKDSVEDILYRNLRKMSDETVSYSTLWLMDLVREDRIYLYSKQELIDDKTKKGEKIDVITGFLRKLLLDFMFDLKHSDLFQNSACYQRMYSGLMSDFYFSALMHKCEYYYYRNLINDQIKNSSENGCLNDSGKERLLHLYASNLCEAERLWTQDIMNPAAEKYFDYQVGSELEKVGDSKSDSKHGFIERFLVRIHFLENNEFAPRDSWFADPEEEMRRVCFPMDERGRDYIHICNANTLSDFLKTEKSPKAEFELGYFAETNKEIISRWFLTRYDFNDVCHLHLSRWANVTSFLTLFVTLFLFVIWSKFSTATIDCLDKCPYLLLIVLCPLFIFFALFFMARAKKYKKKNGLMSIHIKKNSRRLTSFLLGLAVFVAGINYGLVFVGLLISTIILIFHPQTRFMLEHNLRRMTSYLHLLFPRLVASITTAWLTMTMGFDIYVAFFDEKVSGPTMTMIIIIVFVFVMYELNRITPRGNIWKKLLRSAQLVTISYMISLIVGFVVIDFVGRQYMDRGDGFSSLTDKTAVLEEGKSPTTFKIEEKSFGDLKDDRERQNEIIYGNYKPAEIRVFKLGEHEVFFMRNFLIMFSSVTMFMGIFLQMFIFDDKKMTEF